MVMSFVAAALLMSVQLAAGDRASSANRQATRTSPSATVDRPEPVALTNPQSAQTDEWAIAQQPMGTSELETTDGQSSHQPAFLAQWNWFIKPILYPMKAVNAQLDPWTTQSPDLTGDENAAIGTKKGEQAVSLPSPSVVVSPSKSQSSGDSSSTVSETQTTSNAQIHQTEHILTEQAGVGGTGPLTTDPSTLSSDRAQQTLSAQASRLFPHSDPTLQDSTNHAIASDQTGQTDQNKIQPEHPAARLVVDLSDRQLALYHHNEPTQTYPIAVGKVGWETPLGEFTVTDKDPNPLWQHPLTGELVPAGADSPLGSRWIGFWSDGIHQIGFHGTNQSQSIGQAISHGCIRLHDDDIQELYSQIPLGTPVIVQP